MGCPEHSRVIHRSRDLSIDNRRPMFRTIAPSFSSVRISVVCALAIAAALPIAIISLAKLSLLLGTLALMAGRWLRPEAHAVRLAGMASPTILLALTLVATSALWSTASMTEALTAITKHGKLILIPAILCLLRSRREARIALACFVIGQMLLLASTWLMYLGVPIPWSLSKEAGRSYAVFSSYLDQSIMTAVLAALCWHMRAYAPTPYRTPLALAASFLALVCVFFIFQGRTGYLVAIALIALTLLWAMPRRFHIGAMILPLVLLVGLAAGSNNVRDGMNEIGSSIESFSKSGDISTSSGIRLNLWRRSMQSIAQAPWHGTGAGSWSTEFNRQEALHAPQGFVEITGNPHQEYLLWGVELGLPGIVLLCAVMLAIYRDSLQLEQPARRGLQSVLAALALASLFNCALYDALIGDFFCIALALLLAFGVQPAPPTPSPTSTRPAI